MDTTISTVVTPTTTEEIVAEVLGLTVPSELWRVFDEDKEMGLALVHYTIPSVEEYLWIKGVIVDLVEKKVVCASFPGSKEYILSSDIKRVDDTYAFIINDGNQVKQVELTANDVIISKNHDGTLLRVWKHKRTNQVLISTHKRINNPKANWGHSPPFLDIYKYLDGPTTELFPDERYDDVVYAFIICHPAILVGSREPMASPRLLYVSSFMTKPSQYELEDPACVVSFHQPEVLTLEEANKFLLCGYSSEETTLTLANTNDVALMHGEAVSMFCLKNGVVQNVFKLVSSSYDWRTKIRYNEAFVERLVTKYLSRADPLDFSRFRCLSLPSSLPYNMPIFVSPEQAANCSDVTRLANLVYACAPDMQPYVMSVIQGMWHKRDSLVGWCRDLMNTSVENQTEVFTKLKQCKNGEHTVKRVSDWMRLAHKKQFMENTDIFQTLQWVAFREYGHSLDKIFSALDEAKWVI